MVTQVKLDTYRRIRELITLDLTKGEFCQRKEELALTQEVMVDGETMFREEGYALTRMSGRGTRLLLMVAFTAWCFSISGLNIRGVGENRGGYNAL